MKNIAFTYSLLKFVEWFSENEASVDIEEKFSSENNFSASKLKLLPYFLCTANGNREAMFSIFDSFTATDDDGYVEIDLRTPEQLQQNLLNIFNIRENGLEITEQGCQVIDNITGHFSKVNLERFKEYTNFGQKFKPTNIIATENDFFKHLDHSVRSLKEQDFHDNGGIMSLSFEQLSTLSKLHDVYRMYKSGIAVYKDDSKRINIEYLLKEMSMFGNKNKKIQTPIFELFHIK